MQACSASCPLLIGDPSVAREQEKTSSSCIELMEEVSSVFSKPSLGARLGRKGHCGPTPFPSSFCSIMPQGCCPRP